MLSRRSPYVPSKKVMVIVKKEKRAEEENGKMSTMENLFYSPAMFMLMKSGMCVRGGTRAMGKSEMNYTNI